MSFFFFSDPTSWSPFLGSELFSPVFFPPRSVTVFESNSSFHRNPAEVVLSLIESTLLSCCMFPHVCFITIAK